VGMEAGGLFWPPHGLGLHMSVERLRAKPRTIANNSNRRITILIKTLSLLLSLHFVRVLSCADRGSSKGA
jgi:hypothetical protein